MRAMVLEAAGRPLRLREMPRPTSGPGDVLVEVEACGVCRTDLHVQDGDLESGDLGPPKTPLVLGHEVVGRVAGLGSRVTGLRPGQRVGVPWLGHTCGGCRFCRSDRENLCESPEFTGYDRDGGYAEFCVADAAHLVPLPEEHSAEYLAPLLCAGLIGFRTYRLAELSGPGRRVGLYGFGAAAHLLCQLAVADGHQVAAFTRPGDADGQAFARRLGAVWAGGSDQSPPWPLDAALLFAPVGALVPVALRAVDRGGIVVSGGIHMSEIPAFAYADLWQERRLRSVANLTRRDAVDYFARIAQIRLEVATRPYALQDAQRALDDLRGGRLEGAAVLLP